MPKYMMSIMQDAKYTTPGKPAFATHSANICAPSRPHMTQLPTLLVGSPSVPGSNAMRVVYVSEVIVLK